MVAVCFWVTFRSHSLAHREESEKRTTASPSFLINIVLFLIIITKTKEDITFILALPLPTTLFKLLAIRSISAGCGSSLLLLCTSVERAREWNNRQECLELMQALDRPGSSGNAQHGDGNAHAETRGDARQEAQAGASNLVGY